MRSISQYNNTWLTYLHYIWLSWWGKKEFSTTYQNYLNKKKFSITWPQQITLKNKVTYQQVRIYPKSFLVTLKFSSLFIMKSLLNVNLYTWRAFISHVVCLGKTSNSWYKYSQSFLMPKKSVVCTKFPMCSKFNFSQSKTYFSQ